MPDPKEIDLQFERVARETGVSLRAARNETIQQAALAVLRATPVDTGRLRASWFWSNTPTSSTSPLRTLSNSAAIPAALARDISSTAIVADLDQTIYFLNGANYAKYVEARTQFVRRALGAGGRISSSAIRSIRKIQGVT